MAIQHLPNLFDAMNDIIELFDLLLGAYYSSIDDGTTLLVPSILYEYVRSIMMHKARSTLIESARLLKNSCLGYGLLGQNNPGCGSV